ncbi:MAG: glycosyltransferase family 4 protein [Methanobacteriota archaeon]
MKNIQVYFNLGRSSRSRHFETIQNPPEGVTYLNDLEDFKDRVENQDVILNQKHNTISIGKKIMFTLNIPNIRSVKCGECDLIHAPGQLIFNKKPWVTEIDNVTVLTLYNVIVLKSTIASHIIRKYLNSNYCKKILPLSEASKKSIENTFPKQKFLEKLEVAYPYVKTQPKAENKTDKIRILFISSRFNVKGGKEVLKAFKVLNERYDNLELIMITIPPQWAVDEFGKYDNVSFLPPNILKEELYEKYFQTSDVFVIPSYRDSFGLVVLEALAAGLPIVATDMFAFSEMIEDGRNGFIIESPVKYFKDDYTPNEKYFSVDLEGKCADWQFPKVVDDLIEKLSILISDKKLRNQMGEYSHSLVSNGKFSDKVRKKKLRKIYEECL